MPGGDRTGPMGAGPMSGRSVGFCAGFGTAGYMNPARGFRMFGRGTGCGRGRQNRCFDMAMPWWSRANRPAGGFYGPVQQPSSKNEIEMLKADAEDIKETLQQINQRIEQLQIQKPENK